MPGFLVLIILRSDQLVDRTRISAGDMPMGYAWRCPADYAVCLLITADSLEKL